MKRLLKLLLALCGVIAGIYATSPWWIPPLLSGQMPPGYRLEKLEAAYPGLSGIEFRKLQLKAQLPDFDLSAEASGIYVNYKDWKTDVSSILLDVHIHTGEQRAKEELSLDDLSLPIIKLTANPPELSVDKLKLALHHDVNFRPAGIVAQQPLVLDLQKVSLVHLGQDAYRLSSLLGVAGKQPLHGQLSVDVEGVKRKASISFPAAKGSQPWLALTARQTDRVSETTTEVQVMLDAGPDQRDRLGPVLRWASAGRLDKLDGKLQLQARFSGQNRQGIELLSLDSHGLRVSSDDESFGLDATFAATRVDHSISISLSQPFDIRYEDGTGGINTIVEFFAPGLKIHPAKVATGHVTIGADSQFVVNTNTKPLLVFDGNLDLGIDSTGRMLRLRASEVQFEAPDLSHPDPSTINGLLTIELEEKKAFTYTGNDLDVEADEIHLLAEVVIVDGEFVSDGSAIVSGGQLPGLDTSASAVDVSWQKMNLATQLGELKAKTRGLRTEIEGETWTGFDIDVSLSVRENSEIKGSGTVAFNNGVLVPVAFNGGTQTSRWDVTLPPHSIDLTQLDGLLRVARVELPEAIDLVGGHIDLGGDIQVNDTIHARLTINGREMSASLLESSARGASLSLAATYGETVTANGPVSIDVIELAGGIDVRQLTARLNIGNPETIALQDLNANIFDGQLHLDSLQFTDSTIEDTTIELDHINLAKLLAFADIDGLAGTGSLAFTLPAGSDPAGIYIRNGTFSSTGPGHLAYQKAGVTASNIGLQALENFQYKDLSGTINYLSDGVYQIGIHLEGHNPDLYDGHPIKFNLNINGSLPALFEALFISGDFEESILNQVGIN